MTVRFPPPAAHLWGPVDPQSLTTSPALCTAVQFISSKDACIAEIPAILACRAPETQSSSLGSKDFSRRPVAILAGGGYAKVVDEIREAVMKEASGSGPGPVWLKLDMANPPAAQVGSPEFTAAVMNRTKDRLNQLAADGTLGSDDTGVYLF